MPRRDQSSRSTYFRDWYTKNGPDKRRAVADRKAAITAWLSAYKSTLACQRCGFAHPACIEFHHRDPADKIATIALMPGLGYSLAKIRAEIAKCTVLCANCHRILHWEARQEARGEAPAPPAPSGMAVNTQRSGERDEHTPER